MIRVRVIAHIVRAQKHVAHVAQQPAAGASHELGQELGFGHGGGAKADVASGILDDVRSAQGVLHLRECVATKRSVRRRTEAAAGR